MAKYPINPMRKIRKGYEPGHAPAKDAKTSNPRYKGMRETSSNPRYGGGKVGGAKLRRSKKKGGYGEAGSFLGAPVDNDLIGSGNPMGKPTRGTRSPGPVSLNKGSRNVPSITKPKRLAKRRTPKSSHRSSY